MKSILLIITLSIFALIGGSPSPASGSAAGPGPAPTPSPAAADIEIIKNFLITSAASDFTNHQPPYPARFRKVKIGYMGDTTKTGAWRMCGEFFPSEKTGSEKLEWTGFATVKTSGYEQYIGSGSNFCTHPRITWLRTADLAPELKRKLDSLRK